MRNTRDDDGEFEEIGLWGSRASDSEDSVDAVEDGDEVLVRMSRSSSSLLEATYASVKGWLWCAYSRLSSAYM